MTTQEHGIAPDPVQVEELEPAARFSLRLRSAHLAGLGAALAVDLPARIGDRASGEMCEALCLGPDEWLIVAPDAARDKIEEAAASVRGGAPHSLCDISDREITLRLRGPEVLELLATCCPRDLESLAVGRGVRTVFDSATATFWRDGPADFRMDVWRSFYPHVRALLDLAQAELKAGL